MLIPGLLSSQEQKGFQEWNPCILNNPFRSLIKKESLERILVILVDVAWEIGHMGSKGSRIIKHPWDFNKLLWPSGRSIEPPAKLVIKLTLRMIAVAQPA